MARFIVCLPFSNGALDRERLPMLAELGTISTPPSLSSDNRIADASSGDRKRFRPPLRSRKSARSKHITRSEASTSGKIGIGRTDQPIERSRVKLEFRLNTGAESRFTSTDGLGQASVATTSRYLRARPKKCSNRAVPEVLAGHDGARRSTLRRWIHPIVEPCSGSAHSCKITSKACSSKPKPESQAHSCARVLGRDSTPRIVRGDRAPRASFAYLYQLFTARTYAEVWTWRPIASSPRRNRHSTLQRFGRAGAGRLIEELSLRRALPPQGAAERK
jgi:hypothetical protein